MFCHTPASTREHPKFHTFQDFGSAKIADQQHNVDSKTSWRPHPALTSAGSPHQPVGAVTRSNLVCCGRAALRDNKRQCSIQMSSFDLAQPWRKLLYVKQGFPDNYVDETFLDALQKNGMISGEGTLQTTASERGEG